MSDLDPRASRSSGDDLSAEIGSALAAFSVRRPVTISMLFVSLVVLGLIASTRIPLVFMPDIQFPFLVVYVPYPNATPQQIQETITRPLEEVVATIPGVKRMSSTSSSDSAQLEVQFDWDTDVGLIRAQVREKVEQIRNDLPDDVRRIVIRNFSSDDIPILEATLSSDRDLRTSYDFLDAKLKKPIERVAGVADVEIWGAQREQVDIYLRLDDLKRYQVDVGRLFQALDEANLNLSLGRAEDGGRRFSAVSKGVMASVDDIRAFPVNERGLRLEQVADIVYDAPVSNSGQHLNGRYGVGFSVRKGSEANTVETVAAVKKVLADLEDDPALSGVELHIWLDAGKEITKALSSLLSSGTVGALLAVLTLYLFLRRLTPSVVIGLAIPFSVIAALGLLHFSGGTLNLLSMMGLMLSAGMLVDNAVVVLESILQKLEKGEPPLQAAAEGAGEVTTAVIAATLTSIIIFVPLVFGSRSELTVFLGEVGMSVIFALLCSLFISLTLIPSISARLPGGRSPGAERANQAFTAAYLDWVDWPLRHRFLTGFVLIPGLIAGSFYLLANKVPDNTPDAQEMGALMLQYEFSENFHYAKIEREYVGPVEEFLEANRQRFKIRDYLTRYSNNSAWTRVYFDKDSITLDEAQELRRQINEELPVIPGAEIRTGRQQGGQNNSWISANLYGDDPAELARIGAELRQDLLNKPHFSESFAGDDGSREEVQIRLDRALARKLGVNPQTVGEVLAIVARARQIRGYRTPDGEVELWVRMHPDDLQDLNDLRSIIVGAAADGRPIRLEQVARFEIERIAGQIRRENRQNYAWFGAIYSGDKRDEGMKAFQETLDGYAFPPGYSWSFGFWTQQQNLENREMLFNLLLALFMVYFVMAALFESLSHPFAIMLSLPFAAVGIAGFLLATGTPFNIMSRIGMLVLIGIVVNNGIVLIDHINNLRRRGYARSDAIREGCRERLRPILMTASTTVVGLIPLALGDSSIGDTRYFPMARTIMGGLIASTALTLIVLPTYYSLLDDLGRWARRLWRQTNPSSTRGPEPAAGD
jgi:hydrophobic/amphiphilic exporter-1 (mainly G- bacteria), HAE1 family